MGIDYFRKIKKSFHLNTLWQFNPHFDEDIVKEKKLIIEIGVTSFVLNM